MLKHHSHDTISWHCVGVMDMIVFMELPIYCCLKGHIFIINILFNKYFDVIEPGESHLLLTTAKLS